MPPKIFRFFVNLYAPYMGTGIRVKYISPDYRRITVQMKHRFYNRNYVGTHFGGSLYSMTDPFYMLMLLQILGKEYLVWDKAAQIEFVTPGRGTVTAEFEINQDRIDDIVAQTENGEKYLPEFTAFVKDQAGQVVAKVTKTLYVRKKSQYRDELSEDM